MKKNWLYIISPCVLAIAFSLIMIIASAVEYKQSGGWSMIGVFVFVPVFFILILIDFVIKKLIGQKVLLIWVAEIVVLALFYVIVIHRFMD